MQPEFEDYYEILKVSPDAKTEEIRRAYLDKCFILHPDRLGGRESAKRLAEDELKKVNIAYEVLGNEKKRQAYYQEWLRQGQMHNGGPTAGSNHEVQPKPVVEPIGLRLTDAEPHQPQKASFNVKNLGGQCAEIDISPSSPDSFVRVVNFTSSSPNDELPATVDIEVEGADWGQSYRDYVIVSMDGEEAKFYVELQTRSRPSTVRPTTDPFGARTQSAPPQSMAGRRQSLPLWARWIIGIGIAAIVLVFVLPSIVMERLSQPLAMDNTYIWIGVVVGLVILWFTAGKRNSKYFWTTFALLMAFVVLSMAVALGWAILAVVVALSLIIHIRRRKQEKLTWIR